MAPGLNSFQRRTQVYCFTECHTEKIQLYFSDVIQVTAQRTKINFRILHVLQWDRHLQWTWSLGRDPPIQTSAPQPNSNEVNSGQRLPWQKRASSHMAWLCICHVPSKESWAVVDVLSRGGWWGFPSSTAVEVQGVGWWDKEETEGVSVDQDWKRLNQFWME